MDEFAYIAIQIASQIPVLMVLVVGLVLLATRRRTLSSRVSTLAIVGCGVLLAGVLLGTAWTTGYVRVYSDGDFDARTFGLLAAAVGLILTLIHATGLALFIAAVLAARPADPPTFPIPRDGPPQAPNIQAL